MAGWPQRHGLADAIFTGSTHSMCPVSAPTRSKLTCPIAQHPNLGMLALAATARTRTTSSETGEQNV